MNLDQARQRAEKRFKKEERAQDGRQAIIEYKAHGLAVREKTARLKALRLAEGASRERLAGIASRAPGGFLKTNRAGLPRLRGARKRRV